MTKPKKPRPAESKHLSDRAQTSRENRDAAHDPAAAHAHNELAHRYQARSDEAKVTEERVAADQAKTHDWESEGGTLHREEPSGNPDRDKAS